MVEIAEVTPSEALIAYKTLHKYTVIAAQKAIKELEISAKDPINESVKDELLDRKNVIEKKLAIIQKYIDSRIVCLSSIYPNHHTLLHQSANRFHRPNLNEINIYIPNKKYRVANNYTL